MQMKKKFLSLAIAAALAPSGAYAATIVASDMTAVLNATTPGPIATGADVTITFDGPTDAASGTTIQVILPTGVEFSAAPTLTPSGALGVGSATLSNSNMTASWTVSTAPASGNTAIIDLNGSATIQAAASSGLNTTGLQATLILNGGSDAETTKTLNGSVSVLAQPSISSAILVGTDALDIRLNVDVNSSTSTSTLLANTSVQLDDNGDLANANAGFEIEGTGISSDSTDAVTIALDSSDASLIHITGLDGVIAGNNVNLDADNGILQNALGAIDSVSGTPGAGNGVVIQPQGAAITTVVANSGSSVLIGASNDAFNTTCTSSCDPGATGDTTSTNENEFAVVVTGTASSTASVRLVDSAGDAVTTGLTWDTDADAGNGDLSASTTSGAVSVVLDSTTGMYTLYVRNSDVGTTATVVAGYAVQASVDAFNASVSSTESITVDREQPGVSSVTSPDRNTLTIVLSEDMQNGATSDIDSNDVDGNSTTNTLDMDTHITMGGGNTAATFFTGNSTPVTYDSGSMTLSINTNLLLPATNNTVALDGSALDIAGNMGNGTASNPAFGTQGTVVDSATAGAIDSTDAVAGYLGISDGDVVSLNVAGDTGQTIVARFVNLDDGNSTTDISTGALSITEVTSGNYVGTLTLTSTTLAEGTNLGVEVSADAYAQASTATGSYTVDNASPTLTMATPQGNQATILTFSENVVNDGGLTTPSNYDIGSGNPGTAVTVLDSMNILVTHAAVTEDATIVANVENSGVSDYSYNAIADTDTDGVDTASFTGTPADNEAPTGSFSSITAGDTSLTVQLADNYGVGAIDLTTVAILTLVTVDGTPVNTTFTTDDATGTVSIDMGSTTLSAGSEITVQIQVSDRAGNEAQLGLVGTVGAQIAIDESSLSLKVDPVGSATLTVSAGTASSFSSSDDSIATVDANGVVTAVAVGSAIITGTDAGGNTDTVAVTVFAEPNEVLTSGCASGCTTTATFEACASTDNGQTCANSFAATDSISIWGIITPESGHVASTGSLYTFVKVASFFFYEDVDGVFTLMSSDSEGNADLTTLEPESAAITLEASHRIEIIEDIVPGDVGLAGLDYEVFVGYSLDSAPEEIYFNSEPLGFSVAAE